MIKLFEIMCKFVSLNKFKLNFLKNCKIEGQYALTNEEMLLNNYISVDGSTLNPKDVAIPCGLLA